MKRQKIAAFVLALALLAAAWTVPASAAYSMPYYIEVDISSQIVTVYETETKDIARQMLCSTGTNGYTPKGEFLLPGRVKDNERQPWYWIDMFQRYVKYATRIRGQILFHSLPYTRKSLQYIDRQALNEFGQPASHGCIRLRWQDAEFIALNCLEGTYVKIYESSDRKDALRELLFQECYDKSKGYSYDSFLGISDEVGALGRFSEGEAVLNLQYRLRDLGLYDGELNGVYNSTMVNAVRMAQYLMDTGVDGIATIPFQQRMYAPDAPTAMNVRLAEGMSGPAVRALQDNLAVLRLYDDAPDSVYDRAVVDAVTRFQKAYAYEEDGVASPEVQKAVAYEADKLKETFGDEDYSCEQVSETLRLARVNVPEDARLRAEPSEKSNQLKRLPYGSMLIVLQSNDKWSKVRSTYGEGYVANALLAFAEREISLLRYSGVQDAQIYTVGNTAEDYYAGANLPCEVFAEYLAANEQQVDLEALVNYVTVDTKGEGDAVNLREDSSADSAVLDKVENGKSLRVLRRYTDWTQVSYHGQVGYLMNRYLNYWTGPEDALDAEQGDGEAGEFTPRRAIVKCAADGQAAVYDNDADDAQVLGHLKDGVELEVTAIMDGWCRIRYMDREGYMIGEDLRIAPAEEKTEAPIEDSAEGNDEALKVEELLQE